MKIYLAINEFDDLESHFDLRGIYLSKEDLLEDLSLIKAEGSLVYSCEDSVFINLKVHRGSLHQENMSKLLNELNESNEYKEYLKLKAKYEHESLTLDESIKLGESKCVDFIINP